MPVEDIWLTEANDPYCKLEQWVYYLLLLECEYGPAAMLFTDAGHNNVELRLAVTKRNQP